MGESGPASTLDDPRPKFSQASHQPRRFGSAKPGHGPGLEKRKFGTPGRVPGSRPGLLRFEINGGSRPAIPLRVPLGKFPFSAQKSGSPGPGPGPGIVQWRFGVGARVPGSRPGLLRFEIKSMLRPVRARKVRSGAWLSRGSPQKC